MIVIIKLTEFSLLADNELNKIQILGVIFLKYLLFDKEISIVFNEVYFKLYRMKKILKISLF